MVSCVPAGTKSTKSLPRQRLHHQAIRSGPHHRLLADPCDVHDQLRRRQPLPEPDRWRVHVVLRLVLRPAAIQPANLGRANRRGRIGRLVQLQLHHCLGLQRAPDTHPDAHFFTEVRYKGPRRSPSRPTTPKSAKLADIWMHPKQGTDAAVAMAMGHVILKSSASTSAAPISTTTRAATPTCPCWSCSKSKTPWQGAGSPAVTCAPATWWAIWPKAQHRMEDGGLQRRRQRRRAQWFDWLPLGLRPFRRPGQVEPGDQGRLEQRRRQSQTVGAGRRQKAEVPLPSIRSLSPTSVASSTRTSRQQARRCAAAQRAHAAPDHPEGRSVQASLGRHRVRPASGQLRRVRGLKNAQGQLVDDGAKSYDDNVPYTPLGKSRSPVPRATGAHRGSPVRRQRRQDQGRSMVIIGAAMNHWYHCDMNYRGIINMLMMCGCVGQSGGGWAHYGARKSCVHKRVGLRSLSQPTGFVLRVSKTPPASSTPTRSMAL